MKMMMPSAEYITELSMTIGLKSVQICSMLYPPKKSKGPPARKPLREQSYREQCGCHFHRHRPATRRISDAHSTGNHLPPRYPPPACVLPRKYHPAAPIPARLAEPSRMLTGLERSLGRYQPQKLPPSANTVINDNNATQISFESSPFNRPPIENQSSSDSNTLDHRAISNSPLPTGSTIAMIPANIMGIRKYQEMVVFASKVSLRGSFRVVFLR